MIKLFITHILFKFWKVEDISRFLPVVFPHVKNHLEYWIRYIDNLEADKRKGHMEVHFGKMLMKWEWKKEEVQ